MSALAASQYAASASAHSVSPAAAGETRQKQWLEGVSQQPRYTISVVTEKLSAEFPALSVSKVRYFEKPGILRPARTASGYRKYSDADVERLRYALTLQRDYCLPLHKIAEQIEDLEAGASVDPRDAIARVVASDGELKALAKGDEKITVRELLDSCSISRTELQALVKAGFVRPDLSGRFPASAIKVVGLVSMLSESGLALGHIKLMVHNASRSLDLLERSIAGNVPGKQSRVSAALRAKQVRKIQDNAVLMGRLFAELLEGMAREIE